MLGWPEAAALVSTVFGILFTFIKIWGTSKPKKTDDFQKQIQELKIDIALIKGRHPQMEKELELLNAKLEKLRDAFLKYFSREV